MVKMIGKTVVRVTTYEAGAMRKHGSYRIEHMDRERAALDACAHIPVIYGATVIRRPKASK